MPIQANAALVPCGLSGDDPETSIYENCPCTLCHFFILFKNIIDFVLIRIVPAVAVLMLVIGGIMFFGAGENPARRKLVEKADPKILEAEFYSAISVKLQSILAQVKPVEIFLIATS